MPSYIGIDPGAAGALATIFDDGCNKFSIHLYDYADAVLIRALLKSLTHATAVIEKAQAMPKQGVTSMFNYGTNYGRWLERLEICNVPYTFVTPAKWRKAMFDSMIVMADKKEMSRDLAVRLFPSVADRLSRKKDHGRAEALLLAEFCRREANKKVFLK